MVERVTETEDSIYARATTMERVLWMVHIPRHGTTAEIEAVLGELASIRRMIERGRAARTWQPDSLWAKPGSVDRAAKLCEAYLLEGCER